MSESGRPARARGWARQHLRNSASRRYRDVWLLAITVVSMLALGGAVRTADRAALASVRAHAAAVAAAHVAVRAGTLANAIQAQRIDNLRRGCEDQNARHDATIAALQRLYSQPQPPVRLRGIDPAILEAFARLRAAQGKASKAPTIFLIDALAPHRDCDALVRSAQHPPLPSQALAIPPILGGGRHVRVPSRR